MCSINGAFSVTRPLTGYEINWAKKAQDQLRHRGPDETGIFHTPRAILCSNRFSITGLKDGKMPVSNERGDVQVILNGEIYNFRELREELRQCGHTFTTETDTEVLVHGFEQWGVGLFVKLYGMFAFALYDARDSKKPRHYLVRDRFGEKPLFYAFHNSCLFFSSEANPLLAVVDDRVENDAVSELLLFGFSKNHVIRGIQRLPSAKFVSLSEGKLEEVFYWRPTFNTNYSVRFPQALDTLEKLLDDVVGQLLPREVPFGAFISGGLDSALIAAMLHEKLMHSTIRRMTVVQGLQLVTSGMVGMCPYRGVRGDDVTDYSSVEQSGNELEYTRILSQQYHALTYHERAFNPSDYADQFDQMVGHLPGGPVLSTSFPLFWFSSQAARAHNIRVCFSGEGADELFGGYRTSQSENYPLAGREVEYFNKLSGTFSPDEVRQLTGRTYNTETLQHEVDATFIAEGKPEDIRFNRIRHLLSCGLVIDKHMLEKGDGMTMAAPMEMRMPFLDARVAEYVFSLPHDFFIQNTQTKKILRELAKRKKVAKAIWDRPKQRTSLPYKALYYHTAAGKELVRRAFGKKSALRSIMHVRAAEETVLHSECNPKKVHALIILESWLRQFLQK